MDNKMTAMELSKKNQTSSAGRWFGKSVIYGKEDDHATPYMTRYWIGRLRLHIFHRGDQDPDCHDHPWDFWTFPLTPYVEEVIEKHSFYMDVPEYVEVGPGEFLELLTMGGKEFSDYRTTRQVVPAWRLTFRPATHTHRVLGRYERDHSEEIYGLKVVPGNIVTLVWRGKAGRDWGFLKNRDGKWCWVAWREYVFGGGKSAPCE